MILLYNIYAQNERTTPPKKVFQYRYAFPIRNPCPNGYTLVPTDLPLGNGLDPTQRQVDNNSDDANNPNGLLIMRALVSEDDGEDDTAQIADTARAARDDAVREGVHVGYKAEDGTVGAFKEESHAGEETKHGALVVTVRDTDGDLEDAGDDGVGVDEVFLAPDTGAGVDGVG